MSDRPPISRHEKPCKAHSDAFGKIKNTHKRALSHAATVVFSSIWLVISVLTTSPDANGSTGCVISDGWLKTCVCATAVGASNVLLRDRAGGLLCLQVIRSNVAARVVGVLKDMPQATATGSAKHAITTRGTHVLSSISDSYSSKKRQLNPGNRKKLNDKTDDRKKLNDKTDDS